ncbi:hypothetical protein [Natronorubrum texcoconense]|uniref:Yip1 domain-containing protein n=1 Tax=Natronorubrum texcoconense TaxID=1095776 RepID=A0A1G9CW71_9EURY|nr:hypothetical protein [Natronorubrum texcoconense]SDK55664.1 hypothetical protein SAMN04515672_3324 [Natronorubrum texcoconense]
MGRNANDDRRPSNWTVIRPWRKLVQSNDIDGMIRVVRRYGWLPALFGLALHSLARGAFEYLSEPFIIVEGYVFPGWPAALVVNVLFGSFVVIFSWFCYFGLVGVIAGFLSDEEDMVADMFKFGGYLTVLFAPVFLVGSVVIATISVPDGVSADAAAQNGDGTVEFATTAYSFVYDSTQMHAVRILKATAWVVTGFLLLPVVQHLYDIDEKRSVVSVLPVTLVGVITAFLL